MISAQTTGIRTPRAAVHDFIAAWNAHSPDAVRDVFAPDGILRDPLARDGLVGGPAIAAAVQRTLDRYSDVAFTLVSALEAADGRVAFEWIMRATVATTDGRRFPVTLAGCDVCRVTDGKIVELRGYFDRAHVMEQLAATSRS
jgi:ketosteroid isomerase-like protein